MRGRFITFEGIDGCGKSTQIELLKQLLQSDLIPAGSNKDDIIKLLDSIEQTTTAVQGVLQNRIGDLNNAVSGDHTAIKAAANLIDAVMPIVEKQLQADVATMKANISAAYNNMVASLNSMNKGLEGTGVALGSLGNTVSSSNGSFNTLKEIISSAKEELNTILSELNEVEDGEKYDQFIRILSTDPEVMGEFFASPVTIQTERVYPVENYGSSVTPFYTILALWVGAVILVALIKVQVEDEKLMFRIIRASFNQRRKTMTNSVCGCAELGITKEKLIEALEECNLSPTVRGEALTLEQFAKLSNILNARGTK